jgi:hypothetical protein
MIFISNLRFTQLDDAVLSRMDSYELVLTPEEFLCKIGDILLNLKVKGDFTDEEKTWAKKRAINLLGLAIEAWEKNQNICGSPVLIQKSQLQFRLIPTLTIKLLNEVIEEMELSGKNRDQAFNEILPHYIKFVLLPKLRGVDR